jgi:hypothetical protein
MVATAAVLYLSIPRGASTQEKKDGESRINVFIENPGGGVADREVATITLYRDGKAIATKDVPFGSNGATFDKLSSGPYEVRFEALGHKTVVKRVVLRATDKSLPLWASLPKGKGTVVLGAGPSIQELAARIKKLEDDVAKLQKK